MDDHRTLTSSLVGVYTRQNQQIQQQRQQQEANASESSSRAEHLEHTPQLGAQSGAQFYDRSASGIEAKNFFLPETKSNIDGFINERTISHKYASCKERLLSYVNFPSTDRPKKEIIAEAGFYCLDDYQHPDLVRCYQCQAGLLNWIETDNPWVYHANYSGHKCEFIIRATGYEFILRVNRMHRELPPPKQLNTTQPPHTHELALGATASNNEHGNIEYATKEARLNTLKAFTSEGKTAEGLANAGLYYTGNNDEVKCFQCNAAINTWEKEDIPFIKHFRQNSSCSYVHDQLGEESIHVLKVILHEEYEFKEKCATHSNTSDSPFKIFQLSDAFQAIILTIGNSDESMLAIEKALIHWRSTNIKSGNETPSSTDIYSITLDMDTESDIKKEVNASYEKYKQSENTNQLLNKHKEKYYLDKFETDLKTDLKTELGIALANKEKNKTAQNKLYHDAKQENERLKKEISCKHCSINEPNTMVFYPCGHLACKSCSTQLTQCKVCNNQINQKLSIFLA